MSRPAAHSRPAPPPAAAHRRGQLLSFRLGSTYRALAAPSPASPAPPGRPRRGPSRASRSASPRAASCSSACPP
eukprot:scaffold69192_cov72-Phaeocystis_antarctica.AAC.2